jgi:cytochrome c oxidase subunit II
MKRHRQHWLMVTLLVTMLILVGCSPGLSEESSGEEVAAGEMEEVPPAPEPQPEPAPEPEVALSGTLVNGVREIEVVAYQFDFGPDPIRVQQGETVRLLLTTDDVAHGIGLSQFGINARVVAGETAEVTFVADTAGEFTFVCTVPCGAGHSSMTGQLIVI